MNNTWNVFLLTDAEKAGKDVSYLDYRGIFIDKNYGAVLRNYIE